jgi:integrase
MNSLSNSLARTSSSPLRAVRKSAAHKSWVNMKIIKNSRRPKGSAQIRREKRAAGEFWGYDVWIRQSDGSRKRYREFTFLTKADATQALAALRTNGWKTRYGVKPQEKIRHTTIKEAIESYLILAKASLLANKTDDTTYWREMPGHLRTLERWGKFAGPNRHVSTVTRDDFVFWVAAEIERGKENQRPLKKSSIRRGLNTIKAALNHAVETFPDLKSFQVPRSPLTKKVEEERDRVLSDEEIAKISAALSAKREWHEALFFFQLALITAGRMAELRRMRWEESDVRFGTVKIYSSKTKKWRTIKAPSATTLIAQRRAEGEGGGSRVLTQPDHWFRDILKEASESVGIRYGQTVPGGWCPHDLRHTCLTNLALAGVPKNGIKEYAGHASIIETQRYLKFMPQSVELAASVSARLAALADVDMDSINGKKEKSSGRQSPAKRMRREATPARLIKLSKISEGADVK